MRLRFHLDEDTELPHIYGHNVGEHEVHEVLRNPLEQIRGRRDSLIAIGQTAAGRYLKVIFAPDEEGDGIFVITAFDPTPKEVRALPPLATETTMKRDPNKYPKGWNRKKVLEVVEYYENQSENDAIAEAEAAYRKRKSALVEIPVKLLPKVRRLLAAGR